MHFEGTESSHGEHCDYDGCERPRRYEDWCEGHYKQEQRGERMHALTENHGGPGKVVHGSALDRLREASTRRESIPAEPEFDAEFKRADDNLRKAAVAYVKDLPPPRGPGRPPKVDPSKVIELVRKLGGNRAAAATLGVTIRTVRRAKAQYRRMMRKSGGGHN